MASIHFLYMHPIHSFGLTVRPLIDDDTSSIIYTDVPSRDSFWPRSDSESFDFEYVPTPNPSLILL